MRHKKKTYNNMIEKVKRDSKVYDRYFASFNVPPPTSEPYTEETLESTINNQNGGCQDNEPV